MGSSSSSRSSGLQGATPIDPEIRKIVTREELQTEIWGKQTIRPEWGLENILVRLRKDLDDPKGQRYIEFCPESGLDLSVL